MSDYISQGYPLWVAQVLAEPWGNEPDRDEWLESYADGEGDNEWIVARVIGWKISEDESPHPVSLHGWNSAEKVKCTYAESQEEAQDLAVAMAAKHRDVAKALLVRAKEKAQT